MGGGSLRPVRLVVVVATAATVVVVAAVVVAVAAVAVPAAEGAVAAPPLASTVLPSRNGAGPDTSPAGPPSFRAGPPPGVATLPSPAVKSGDGTWCTYRNTGIGWYYQALSLYNDCLPPEGHAKHTLAREIGYSILNDFYSAVGRYSACYSAEKTNRILSNLAGVAPYISPTCTLYLRRTAVTAGGGIGRARAKVGGFHPLAALSRTAASALASVGTTGPSGSPPVMPPSPAAAVSAPVPQSGAGKPLPPPEAARITIMGGTMCCEEYEEYAPTHSHPCCHSGCRIASEYLPFITQEECCDFTYLRQSTGEWYLFNREGRNC